MFVKFEDGHVHYQDEFGRTEKQRDFLNKEPPTSPLRPGDLCGCGSGLPFKSCCQSKPIALRPTWSEPSIRERNIMLLNGIVNVLGLEPDKDWTQVRRDLTDEQISRIYLLYEGLWPLETDLLQLLPKPDGSARAVYTGYIHPATITEFALSASLYFGELLIEHPFIHAGTVKKEFSPVENPRAYRQEFLKAILFFLTVMPLVEAGRVNLTPDPCNFDFHLRKQMFHMAELRSAGIEKHQRKDARMEELMKQQCQRSLMLLPRDVLRSRVQQISPELDGAKVDEILRGLELLREHDPLAVLQEDSLAGGKKGGQFNVVNLAPNFEIAMYLAQATGSCILTDSDYRWNELRRANRQRAGGGSLNTLANRVGESSFAFAQDVEDIAALTSDKTFAAYPALMRDAFKYLSNLESRGAKPNFEAHLAARFDSVHAPAQAKIKKARIPTKDARIACLFPSGGIQDNTVNRLLLMSSSERHLPSVPMAFFIEERVAN
jgi:hypothetical protein